MLNKITTVLSDLKKSSFYETLKHSKNYLFSSVAKEGLKFISVPVLTHLLTPNDYGIINIFATYVQIFAILLILNFKGAIARYYYERKQDYKQFVGLSLSIVAAIFSFSIAGFLLFPGKISGWLDLPVSVIPYFIPAVLLAIVSSVFRQVMMPRKRTKKIMKLDITQTYIGFGLAVIFILMQNDELYLGRLRSIAVVFIVFGFIKMREVLKYTSFNFKFNKHHIKYIANFAIPAIPYLLSGLIISQFDRLMINSINGSKDAGLYSFAYNIAMLQLMVSSSLHNAWTPNYYKYMDDHNFERMDRDTKLMIKIIFLTTIALIFFSKEIGALLSTSSYHDALFVIPIILIGHLFVGLSPFNKNAILYAKKTYITAAITLSGGILNVVLNSIFIPKYGFVAAAYTTLASYFYIFMVEFIVSKFVLKFHVFDYTKIKVEILVIVLAVILYYTIFNSTHMSLIVDIILKLLLLAGFLVIIFWREKTN